MSMTLEQIHWDVFGRFYYRKDKENPLQFNRRDYWVESDKLDGDIYGDCEEFALASRKLCRANGIRSRLVYCKTETGAGHLVLESEGFILDNRRRSVVRRDDLPYVWLKISGYETGDPWHTIK